MRGSKMKKLRQWARVLGRKLPVVKYQPLKPTRIMPVSIVPIPGALFLGQVRMDPKCQRHIYQQGKAHYKRQPQNLRRMNGG